MTELAQHPSASPLPLARFAAALTLAAACGAALAAGLCQALGFVDQLPALGSTAVGCLLAAVVSLLPVKWRATASDSGVAQGFVIGMFLRLVLTGLSVVVLERATALPVNALGFWTAGWYLLLLTVEAALLAGYARKAAAA